jgi:hypothetical protein
MRRPVHSIPPAPKPPRQRPTRVSLGTYSFGGTEYEAEMVVTAVRCSDLARRASKNRDGRAEAAGGGIVVLVRRVTPPEGGPR